MPRVLPQHRRHGIGGALLEALAEHCSTLGVPTVRAKVDDEESFAFAQRFGFAEADREVEQVRTVADRPAPPALPEGVEVVTSAERPGLWEDAYDRFGREALAGSPSTPRSRSLPSSGPRSGWVIRCSWPCTRAR